MSKYYITVSKGMSGYYAVLMEEGDNDPWETGIGRYQDEADAIEEAKQWAKSIHVSFK